MSAVPTSALARLHRAVRLPDPDGPPDADLLARFARDRDEAAFAELVRRHGAMVLAVARGVLGNAADADDAFQAAFLVLARKAGRLAGVPAVGGWLHGVARRAALKARRAATRRTANEAAAAKPDVTPPPADPPDWLAVVEEEVGRLPEKYRLPVVLCGVCGTPRADVAAALGVPAGTLASRLAAGRKRLADQLRRRGVAVPAGLVAVGGLAAVPSSLAAATVRAATGVVPPAVSELATEVTRAMLTTKLRNGVAVVAVALGAAVGVGAAGRPGPSADERGTGDRGRPAAGVAPEPKVPAIGERKGDDVVGPAAAGDPDWAAGFRAAYGLGDRQAVRLVGGTPFLDARAGYVGQAHRLQPDPDDLLLTLAGDGRRLVGWDGSPAGLGPGKKAGRPVWQVVESFRLAPRPVLDGDDDLLGTKLYADAVVREGATLSDLARDLPAALKAVGVAAKVTARAEEREVTVARGKFAPTGKPGAGVFIPGGQAGVTLDLADGPIGNPPGGVALHLTSSRGHLFPRLGEVVGRPVVDETDADSWGDKLGGVRFVPRGADDRRPLDQSAGGAAVLRHVAAQTGLTFTTEKRTVWVLTVEKAEGK